MSEGITAEGRVKAEPAHQGLGIVSGIVTSTLDSRLIPTAVRGDDVEQQTITESLLAEFIENGAVSGIKLKETAKGFQVLATVPWGKSKEYLVVTQRTREPKLWSSLDRLVKHLGRYPNPPPIEIKLETGIGTDEVTRRPKASKPR